MVGREGHSGGPGFERAQLPDGALGRRRIGGEVIRAQYRRKNLAEIDELRLQAFDLEANSAAAVDALHPVLEVPPVSTLVRV
jgi:hypothetical protein